MPILSSAVKEICFPFYINLPKTTTIPNFLFLLFFLCELNKANKVNKLSKKVIINAIIFVKLQQQ